ncbi:MAG: hypothetical protein ACXWV6_04355 [Chitinophagaceae bacterium]
MNDENIIKSIPVRRDKEIAIKQMEIDTVNRVISDADMKTEITQSERILISIFEQLSIRPFPISEKISLKRGIPFDMTKYEDPFFSNLIRGYMKKGKALNRKGIKEDVDIVSAYFQAQIERSKEAQRHSTFTK